MQCCHHRFADRLLSIFSIGHEVSGGWKDYRNSDALKKAEVECVLLQFRGWFSYAMSVEVAGKPLSVHCLHVCVSVFVFFVSHTI